MPLYPLSVTNDVFRVGCDAVRVLHAVKHGNTAKYQDLAQALFRRGAGAVSHSSYRILYEAYLDA